MDSFTLPISWSIKGMLYLLSRCYKMKLKPTTSSKIMVRVRSKTEAGNQGDSPSSYVNE